MIAAEHFGYGHQVTYFPEPANEELVATTLGVRVHPMSQILEIPEQKAEVAKLIPKPNVFPQHTFRLGYAEQEKEYTPRWPLEEVLVR